MTTRLVFIAAALALTLTACFVAAPPVPPPPVTVAPPAPAQAPPAEEGPFLLADKYVWVGPEGNLAMDISAKFRSTDAMLKHLDLRREVGTFQGKPWQLHQLLVATDHNANGDFAAILISGPAPLVEALSNSIGSDPDVYDFNAAIVPTTTSGEVEAESGEGEGGEEGEQ